MFRVFYLSLVVFLCGVGAAAAQLPVAAQPATGPQSGLSLLAAALKAGQAKFEQKSVDHWVLTGQVDIPIQGGITIFADEVNLHFNTDTLIATGNVAFTNPEGRISAEKIEFNFTDGTATFHQAFGIVSLGATANRAEFGNQDPDVYFYGERIDKLSPKKYRITRGGFSTCVQPTPRWAVTSNTIDLNLDDYALARGTVLRIKGVPLLYLPILYYPLQEDQRSTGFLMPTYGTSIVQGGRISNAFFWAIGRSQDATFYHDFYTSAGTGVGAEYRYMSAVQSSGIIRFYRLSENGRLVEGATTPRPDKTTYQVNAAVNQDIWRLKAQGTVEYFTDVQTQQIHHQNSTLQTQSRRTIAGGLSGTFGPATLASYFQRSEIFSDARNSTVYGSLPRATAFVTPTRLFGTPIYAGVTSEYAFIPSQQRLDGRVTSDATLGRLDLSPSLRAPLSRLPFLSVNSAAAYRQNYVWPRLASPTAAPPPRGLTRQDFSLQTDIVGPVMSKIWDTPDSSYSERMKHVIEPTFGVNYVTEINARPLLTTTPGTTLPSTASTRFTYGLTNRLIARKPAVDGVAGGTREFLTIGVQQTFYTDPVAGASDSTYVAARPRPTDLSPVAVLSRFSPRDGFDVNSRLEYDMTGNGFRVFTAGGTFSSIYGGAPATLNSTTGNISFSRQRSTPTTVSSYLSGTASKQFLDGRSSLTYAVAWDLAAGYIYSQSVSGGYLAQCCGIRADYQVVNYPPSLRSTVPRDRRFNFAFVLAGLGTFSNFFGLFGGQQ